MSPQSLWWRYRAALVGPPSAHGTVRGWDGYTLWQRYWAGLLGFRLAPTDPAGAFALPEKPAWHRMPPPVGGQRRDRNDGDPRAVLRLSTLLPSAADSTEEIRTQSAEAVREPFTVRLTVTATGRAEIAVSARLAEDRLPWVTGVPAVVLVPVRVSAEAGSTRYLLPLGYSDGEVAGSLNIPVPPGGFVEADLDGPPIGAAEASLLDATEVERSIRALRTTSARARWEEVAAVLPAAHPLRAVIAREAQ